MANPTNFTMPTKQVTNYDLEAADSTDILLLQTGDSLLLQNGVDNLLIESGIGVKPVNYVKSDLNPTNYVPEVAI